MPSDWDLSAEVPEVGDRKTEARRGMRSRILCTNQEDIPLAGERTGNFVSRIPGHLRHSFRTGMPRNSRYDDPPRL
jgi:hypothetical protein